MRPIAVDWKDLQFGVEIEFVGGDPENVELLPGWIMSLDEKQIDETGSASGSELKPPPMLWNDREQIREMLARLRTQGTAANWSCGLHVHVGLEPWGQQVVAPLIKAALLHQDALQCLLQTSEHRLIFCPPVKEEMRERFIANPVRSTLRNSGRPQSHRCGINLGAWFDIGTVEIRYANGSLDYNEVMNTVELCLRFVAAVGAGLRLSSDPRMLAMELGAPITGYPPSVSCPQWYRERMWLEDLLIPVLTPLTSKLVQDGEIHHILPVSEGIFVAVEKPDGSLCNFIFRQPAAGWELLREVR